MSDGRLPPRSDGDQSSTDLSFSDLSFGAVHRHRPFEVVAPGFVAVSRTAVGAVTGVVRSDVSPPAPFAAVQVDVEHLDGVLVAGLATGPATGPGEGPAGEQDRVVATYTSSTRTAAIEVHTAGRTRVVRRAKVRLPGSFSWAFVVCENQVTVLVRPQSQRRQQQNRDRPFGGWRPLLTERVEVARLVDLRRPATLERFGYTWGVRSGTAHLGDVRAGLFGMTGLRDPHLVQHADGSPVIRDGKAFMTWTCAGPGFFPQAHWGVFTLDLDDPTRLQQVAQLFSHRDALVLGDHAGQLVRDGDRWLVATSSWGNFDAKLDGNGVHVRHLTTTDDLLSGVHLLRTEPTPMPTRVGSWDPVFTRVDDRWFLGFVESPSQAPFDFHPALASTADASPFTGLTMVGAAEDLHRSEGPVISQIGGRWCLLASDARTRTYPVFDLAMRRVGRLEAPYPSNIPHPQLVRRPDGSWLMVTFDGTQYAPRRLGYGGHGDVVVMASPGR